MTILALQLDRPMPRTRTGFFAQLSLAIAGWRKRRAQRLALQDLMAFSPYMLDDLGISADDIAVALEQRAFVARRRS